MSYSFLFEIGNLYISDIANEFAILTINCYFFIMILTNAYQTVLQRMREVTPYVCSVKEKLHTDSAPLAAFITLTPFDYLSIYLSLLANVWCTDCVS